MSWLRLPTTVIIRECYGRSGPISENPIVIDIRDYQTEDYAQCRSLWVELTVHHREIYDAPEIGGMDPGAGFDEYLAMPTRTATWVAVESGDVIGLSGLLVNGAEGEVEPVVVAAGHRGSGIGAALVARAVEVASAMELATISVRPVARNAGAIRFFYDAGFATLGHIEMFMMLQPSDRHWSPGISFHDRQWLA